MTRIEQALKDAAAVVERLPTDAPLLQAINKRLSAMPDYDFDEDRVLACLLPDDEAAVYNGEGRSE